LLQAHHLPVVIGAPDQTSLVIHSSAGWTNQQHVTAARARLRADVFGIVACIPRLLHEYGNLLLWCDLVEDVVEQTGEKPVAGPALRDPDTAFGETESTGKLHQLRVRRDDLVECRVGPCDREGLGLGWRAVAAHLRTGRSALCLHSHSRYADYGDRK